MAKIVNKEVYNAIRAFNERLSYAEKRYGKGSAIVKELRSGAQNVPQLTWTKSGKISTGVKNQEAINKPFMKSEFSKYVHNASAAEIIKSKFSKEQISEIEKLKGKARAKKEEEIFSKIQTMASVHKAIFGDVYKLAGREAAIQCYDKAKSGEYDKAVNDWSNGNISTMELTAILSGENENDENMYDDVPDLYEDLNDEEYW